MRAITQFWIGAPKKAELTTGTTVAHRQWGGKQQFSTDDLLAVLKLALIPIYRTVRKWTLFSHDRQAG